VSLLSRELALNKREKKKEKGSGGILLDVKEVERNFWAQPTRRLRDEQENETGYPL
jgi:hypothetical protein